MYCSLQRDTVRKLLGLTTTAFSATATAAGQEAADPPLTTATADAAGSKKPLHALARRPRQADAASSCARLN